MKQQVNKFNFIAPFLSLGLVVGAFLTIPQILPGVFAVNNSAKVWTFNSPGNFTTSLTEVDENGAHPAGGAVGANEFTNPDFASGNSSWGLAHHGWVEVPGNAATYGTSDFLMMQYEAKYDCTGDEEGNTAAECSANADSGLGLDYRDISSFDSANVVSTADGAPIVHIDQTESIGACPSNSRLITNAEWMTIARNIEAQSTNWADGTIGSLVADGGGLFRGNVQLDGDVTSVDYDGTNPEYGKGRNTKARHTLSNGSEIWDFSGNVWEFTSDTITEEDQPDVSGETGFQWRELTDLTSYGSLSYDLVRPSETTYNYAHGMGRIYHNSGSASSTVRGFVRGGGWSDREWGGIYTLGLSPLPGDDSVVFGYRCTTDPVTNSQSFSSGSGRGASGGNTVSIGSSTAIDGKIFQNINVGDASTYDFTAYVYDTTAGNDGGTVDSTIAELYSYGSSVDTTYTDAGDGWWKLTGTLTGADESREYGVLVKSGKTVKVDDFTLNKQGEYSVYTTTLNTYVLSWDTFCEGSLSGSTCTENATQGGNSTIKYQICTNDGSTCESTSSWKYWDGDSWETASNTTTHVNTAAELTQTAIQALPVASQKIAVKAVFTSSGADVPFLPNISIGYTGDVADPTDFELDRPVDNSYTTERKPTFRWKKSTDETSGIAYYDVVVDGMTLIGNIDPNDPGSSANHVREDDSKYVLYDGDFIQVYAKNKELTEGVKKWLIRAVDIAGNSKDTGERTLSIDLTPPSIRFDAFDYQTSAFTGVADANSQVNISFDSHPLMCQTEADETSFWECTPAERLLQGTYQTRIKATDLAGNTTLLPLFNLLVPFRDLETETTEITTTEPTETSQTPEEKDVEDDKTAEPTTYEVNIKVVDINKQPVAGATVTLFSTPREATTDADGIAKFSNVEKGDHRVVVAYKGQVGEQPLTLEGESPEIAFTIQIESKNPFLSPEVILVIASLAILVLILIYILIRLQTRSKKE